MAPLSAAPVVGRRGRFWESKADAALLRKGAAVMVAGAAAASAPFKPPDLAAVVFSI